MTQGEMRDLLAEVADRVEDVDLLPRVARSIRWRHRRRVMAATGSTTLVLATGSYLGVQLSSAPSQRPVGPLAVSPSPSHSTTPTPQASRSVMPTYLPPGVSFGGKRTLTLPPQTVTESPPSRYAWYTITGPANANTESGGSLLTQHPATLINVQFGPGMTRISLPPELHNPRLYRSRHVQIGGNPGLVSTPTSGYGAFRIDWLDPDGYHSILCDRLKTPDGRSGVNAQQLLEMARSLYR